MKHSSVKLTESPIEFINITPVNPLISKCQIKVCYVGETPNRNRSIITKDVAKQMANSLPGCPIVGYYNEEKQDFEEHNRIIDISNGEFKIKDTTRPYGFVDLNAKCWFQKFIDDETVEHEYLMTEGYLWTEQYKECKRVIDNGNNQSMELDEKTLDATWSKDNNGKPQFFIINEAIISKLCILGEENEPCFEGSQITSPTIQFSFEDGFKNKLFSMMEELKDLLNKGGAQVFTTYAVEIGDSLWSALYSHVETTYPDSENAWYSIYNIDGVFEENDQKFAVLQNRSDMKYYRLDFSFGDNGEIVFANELVDLEETYTPAEEPQFALADVEAYQIEYAKKKKDEEDANQANDNTDDDPEGKEKVCPECGKPLSECTCKDDGKKKKNYNLDEVEEYAELLNRYSELETNFNNLTTEKETLNNQLQELTSELETLKTFKLDIERKAKEEMIAKFYMLSDEDKQDIVNNINTYSVEDIEKELSVICVRKRISFDDESNPQGPTSYNLNDNPNNGANMPDWVKAVQNVANKMK